MKIDRLKQMATELEDAFRRQNDLRVEIADICTVIKANAEITNMQLRAVKRIVKARANDTIEKLRETMDEDQLIFDALSGSTNNLSVAPNTDHDPETGEIIESGELTPSAPVSCDGATPVEGDIGGDPLSGTSPQPVEARHIDTRTPEDILGDDPIPAFLKRQA